MLPSRLVDARIRTFGTLMIVLLGGVLVFPRLRERLRGRRTAQIGAAEPAQTDWRQFVEVMASAISSRHPAWQVTPAHDFAVEIRSEGRLWNFNLGNLYRETRGDTERAVPELDRFVQRMMAPGKSLAVEADFAQVKDKLRPALVPRSFVTSNQLAAQPFAADVWEAFVIDGEHELNYLPDSELRRWNLTVEQLHTEAVRALTASRAVTVRADPGNGGKYLFLNELDGYDAARLVVPEVRDAIGRELGYPYLVATPNRDFAVAWSASYEHGREFAAKARQDFGERGYPISAVPWRVDSAGAKPIAGESFAPTQ